MITGELKAKIDRVWDAFWSGGISNPLEVMEQITYLLFIRRLDDLHTAAENKANRLGQPIENAVYPQERGSTSNVCSRRTTAGRTAAEEALARHPEAGTRTRDFAAKP